MEPKRIEDITRKEWIQYRWQELPSTFGDPDRIFMPAGRRTPDEAYAAMEQWDMTAEERDAESGYEAEPALTIERNPSEE